MLPITEVYHWRYATKKFDPQKKVPEEALRTVLETARLAPSSFGIQPWHFFLVEDVATRARIWEHAWKQDQIKDASHLLAFASRRTVLSKDVLAFVKGIQEVRGVSEEAVAGYRDMMLGAVQGLSPEASGEWASKQTYLALGFVLATLAQMHIDACPMEGFDAEKVGEILGVSAEEYRVVALLPFGYRAEDDTFSTLKKVRFAEEQVLTRC